ncbi:hypothetical protein BN1723_000775 [Verticillium longisporum]|uniref:DUF7779 domain-containing protein n=1 Tax=Verticillium longisporum TaxID=100787 RepID=A0A0G4M2X6_VERLO|nr:hypothetical protein BN1708_015275 [Verticillium longisporum]CRK42364.1 hypothetical protein BN1723_000775 [Verticillium longisporum]
MEGGFGPSFGGSISGRNVFAGTSVAGDLNVRINNIETVPQRTTPVWMVPVLPDADFVERPTISSWLTERLVAPPYRAARIGLGGIGKSQLAIHHACQIAKLSDIHVLWVFASTVERFKSAYRNIARDFRIPGYDAQNADVLQMVHSWLCDESHGKWLMILDNVDDARILSTRQNDEGEPLSAFLPMSSNGSFIITSRSRDAAFELTGDNKNIFDVPVMDEGLALQLVRRKLGDKDEPAILAELVKELGEVPLAITQAAAYIGRQALMSPTKYLDKLRLDRKQKAKLLNQGAKDMRRDYTAHNSIFETWQITFELIWEEQRSAAYLLAFMSFFSAQNIPSWMLQHYVPEQPQEDQPPATASSNSSSEASPVFEDNLTCLTGYSLVGVDEEKDVLDMHPMVQFCTQEWLKSKDRKLPTQRLFFDTMSSKYLDPLTGNLDLCHMLDQHLGPLEDERDTVEDDLAVSIANVLIKAGVFQVQKCSYQRVVTIL